MSEKHLPNRSGNIPLGTIGLLITILFCVVIAVSPARLYLIVLEGALGFAGLIISVVGIAKGSGRMAGLIGILVFLLGCLMTYTTILDLIAYERAHSG
jgi:hypothetical protein